MKRKPISLVSLASALAALGAGLPATEASASTAKSADSQTAAEDSAKSKLLPNFLVSTGEDLLGFTITRQADGTIIAEHRSHASHASHSSHASHFSSR